MASKYDYKLVNNDPSLKVAISELRQKIEHNVLLAVDCEGVDLSRKGTLTIITVATEEKVYIFDVLELGKRATVRSGLREILDNKSCTKLMFDCRQDSDALWHQLNVRLTGVLDLQLLETLTAVKMTQLTAMSFPALSIKLEAREQMKLKAFMVFVAASSCI